MKKVCLLAFVLFTWSIVVNAQESDGRYVEVTGSSEIEVVPDEIHFLVQIKEYWQEEYTGKSKKEEDFRTIEHRPQTTEKSDNRYELLIHQIMEENSRRLLQFIYHHAASGKSI